MSRSTEPSAGGRELRAAPGESITSRLVGRGRARARVGPRASFFHRMGVPDHVL
ncbi:MAG: hypothetical protein R3F59_00835 [Myxococcota bacterium]